MGVRQLYGMAAVLLKFRTLLWSILVSNNPTSKDGSDMGGSTGCCQSLRHRVSAITSASVVHPFEGEDSAG